jgi:class 3 adenylate cyclase
VGTWFLRTRSGDKQPEQVPIRTGTTSLGRLSTNDIVVDDVSASRRHAEISFDPATDTVMLQDINSTNGTYVNRQRIANPVRLQHGDSFRIGKVSFYLISQTEEFQSQSSASGTHLFTRELVLESLDQHAVLLFDVARRLNTVTDLEEIRSEITLLLGRALGVDRCKFVLASEFDSISAGDCAGPIAQMAIVKRSAEVSPQMMSVPVLVGETVEALICMRKEDGKPPFNQQDLQLAVAFSIQASLALQRIELNEQVRKQSQVQNFLRRFLAPQEAEFLLQDYLETGHLPELSEQTVTILFSDIADSTLIAEHIGTKKFAEILSNYYQTATDIIFGHGGIVRYLGDGIMAVFMQSPGLPNPEEHAVQAARELVQRMNATGVLNANQRFVMGVSINTGKAMIGYVGNAERAEFAVLGDTVNVAYRMQQIARPYKIVVGPATVAAVVNKFRIQRIGAVTLHGREKPIQVYEVLP